MGKLRVFKRYIRSEEGSSEKVERVVFRGNEEIVIDRVFKDWDSFLKWHSKSKKKDIAFAIMSDGSVFKSSNEAIQMRFWNQCATMGC